jgi:hypothetical protein
MPVQASDEMFSLAKHRATEGRCDISIHKKCTYSIVKNPGIHFGTSWIVNHKAKYVKRLDISLLCPKFKDGESEDSEGGSTYKYVGPQIIDVETISEFTLMRIICYAVVPGDFKFVERNGGYTRCIEYTNDYKYRIIDVDRHLYNVQKHIILSGDLNGTVPRPIIFIDRRDEQTIENTLHKLKSRLDEKSRRILEIVTKCLPMLNRGIFKIIRDYVVCSNN